MTGPTHYCWSCYSRVAVAALQALVVITGRSACADLVAELAQRGPAPVRRMAGNLLDGDDEAGDALDRDDDAGEVVG